MRRGALAVLLALSWIASIFLAQYFWDTIKTIQIAEFEPLVWFVMLFVLNWIGINLILTVFFFRGLPDFVLQKDQNATE